LAGVIGLAGLGAFLIQGLGEEIPETVEAGLFFGFSGVAVAFAFLMITGRNPARSALAFAVVILSTCGLFLLLAAPFLMAATIVIYAGAIIVTFLFIMPRSSRARRTRTYARASRNWPLPRIRLCWPCLLVGLQRVYDWRSVDTAIEKAATLARAETIDLDYLFLPPGDDGLSGNRCN
jgi:NADH:ubiquinone oxidoreductase subunit 6 (subunit J)